MDRAGAGRGDWASRERDIVLVNWRGLFVDVRKDILESSIVLKVLSISWSGKVFFMQYSNKVHNVPYQLPTLIIP